MPKRKVSDVGIQESVPDAVVQKTERSHEENQERAYIAASRRQDRSIEARVQSARMASEIHKKRTGKGFRISEEIVRREEMYEEEEEDLPRSFQLLNRRMQTESPEFNRRIEAWMAARYDMSQYCQHANDEGGSDDIDAMFAKSFPNVAQQARRVSRTLCMNPGPASQQAQGGVSPNSDPSNFQSFSSGNDRSGDGAAAVSPTDQTQFMHNPSLSPPELTHGSSTPDTPTSRHAPALEPEQSPFTTGLPNEMKLMMGTDMDFGNPYDSMYAQDFANMGNTDMFHTQVPTPSQGCGKINEYEQSDLLGEDSWQAMDELPWDTFLDDNVWTSDP